MQLIGQERIFLNSEMLEKISLETAVGYYYDYLTSELKVDNLPIIICNTLEKRTSFVETHKNQFFLVFDNYVVELFHQLNEFILRDGTDEDVEAFFYKTISKAELETLAFNFRKAITER